MARPSIFTQEIADTICSRIASGESLRKICEDDGLPDRITVHYWLLDSRHKEFFNQYAKARSIQAELLFEELKELSDVSVDDIVGNDKSDGARVQARKLQIDTRKWYLSKVVPKKFGDKLDLTSDGKQLPTPILKLNVLPNNSDGQNTGDGETNTGGTGGNLSE